MILINSSPKNALKIFQPFLPISVPISIGYLLSAAEREGITAHIVDEQIEDDVLRKIGESVRETEPPYFFGFSVLTVALKSAVSLAEKLKRLYPTSIICFGGIHPTAEPEEVLSFPQVDVVIREEGETPLIELYRCVKEGRDFTHIKNLSYRHNGGYVHNEIGPIEDLTKSPAFPYHRFTSKRYDFEFVMSSRGCPYNCIFCSNRVTTGKRYRFRPMEAIIEDIDILYHKYQRRYVSFSDDNLLVKKDRAYTLMDELNKRGFHKKMTFGFQARGDSVDRKILGDLYESGFRNISFGLKTASERIMKIIKKGETVAQCAEAIRIAKEVGFHVNATFIYGLPGDTHEDRMACIRMSKDLGLEAVRFNNATPYPGTELNRIAKSQGRLYVKGLYENFLSVSTFIENPFRPIPFSYVPEGNTEPEIRRDILFSFFSHYLDMGRLKLMFTRAGHEAGWFNPGERLFDILKKIPALIALAFMMFVKFVQLFYYSVLKKETAISMRFF